MVKRLSHLLVPLIAIILGLAAGALIMLTSGYSVISGYSALWNGIFGEIYYVGETIRQITPYILSGLAVAFAFRTGLFNIGVEGRCSLAGQRRFGSGRHLTDRLIFICRLH